MTCGLSFSIGLVIAYFTLGIYLIYPAGVSQKVRAGTVAGCRILELAHFMLGKALLYIKIFLSVASAAQGVFTGS